MGISKLAIVKFAELALTCICIGLHYNSFEITHTEEVLVITGTFCGYLIILVGGFAGHLMNTPIHKRIDIFFSLLGCALFVASGALIIQMWDNAIFKTETRRIALAKGSLAIINGAVFLLDTLFTFRG